MADEGIPLERTVELVKYAYERAAHFEQSFRDSELDASKTEDQRSDARLRRDSAEREFAWQWRNVKRIFEEKGI
jgi:hypothetical protein